MLEQPMGRLRNTKHAHKEQFQLPKQQNGNVLFSKFSPKILHSTISLEKDIMSRYYN